MPQQSIDHHYVPRFYLKRWAGPTGLVVEYSRPHRELVVHSKTPKATGFQKHLYTLVGLPTGKQSVLEDVVLKQIDQIASDALDFMIGNSTGGEDIPPKLRDGWSRFLMSLMHRGPTKLAALKTKSLAYLAEQLPRLERDYPNFKEPSDPNDFAQMAAILKRDMTEVTWAKLFESLMDNPTVGSFLNAMHWSIATVGNPEHHLLTSDHPLVMTNGIEHVEGYVIVPIGPSQIFIAVNSEAMAREFAKTDPYYLVPKLNDTMVKQAVSFVYDTDDRQKRFIANRFRMNRFGRCYRVCC